MGGSLSSRPFYGVCRRVRGCSPGTGSIPECSTRPKIYTKEKGQKMEKRHDAYLAVTLDGDDIEIQVDGHAGDIAQIAAMALADVIVQSSPGKEQAIKILDDMKNQLDGMLDDAWNARNSEIEYGKEHSVQRHGEKAAAIAETMAKLKENTDAGCFGDCAACAGSDQNGMADASGWAQDTDNGLPS